jgi:hypothetical protein
VTASADTVYVVLDVVLPVALIAPSARAAQRGPAEILRQE